MTTLSIIIPSVRKLGLLRTLESLRGQLSAEDEVIIVQEPRHHDPMQNWLGYGFNIRCFADKTPGSSAWGYKARRYGMTHARGEWIHCIGDDDAYLPGAIEEIKDRVCVAKLPCLFRMRRNLPECRGGGTDFVWRNCDLKEGDNIAGEMFVFPNDPEQWGKFGDHYCGDNDFIRQTVANYGGKVVWWENEICIWRAH